MRDDGRSMEVDNSCTEAETYFRVIYTPGVANLYSIVVNDMFIRPRDRYTFMFGEYDTDYSTFLGV